MSYLQAPRPVFIAALPREVAGFVQGWRRDELQRDETHRGRGIHLYWNDQAILACAGMGADRARLAVEAALGLGSASELISIGWAGATSPHVRAGDILHIDIVIDAKTGERFFTDKSKALALDEADKAYVQQEQPYQPPQILVTVAQPAGAIEKKRLGVSYYALAVDMEAAAVARLARARGLPFSAIKAVSDELGLELPDLAPFITPRGQMREAAFGLHVALRPALWRPVLELAKGSRLAAERLRQALQGYLSGEPGNLSASNRNQPS